MASYPYEQLNDESFQQLSQSLLLKAFPDLQCFPVGQPDGGRDAIVRLPEAAPDTTGFILFQVKFARRELNPSEARDWLLETLKRELPKVQKQIGEGAERFVLVTNVSGPRIPRLDQSTSCKPCSTSRSRFRLKRGGETISTGAWTMRGT